MNNGTRAALAATAAAAMLLAGCGMSPAVTSDGSPAFPDRSRASLPEGTFVNVDNLRQVQPGLTKRQVYELIREPHFNEGIVGVHVWNYVFDLRDAGSEQIVACQYQVQFDRHYRVKGTYWKDARCAELAAGDGQKTAPAVQGNGPDPGKGGETGPG
ncbi:hypothetical protein CY652_22735 [Burkholderia sp. WAC0059]|uniref:outer membrane protein assembly factor BamE n=1 Tax=Burkholderia sp. WAC0059 TaxID=2066022 RepID=UPI000C7F24C9|nr:hypothetical protein CY652_22735 [Burkholderia sp. WAC0059]